MGFNQLCTCLFRFSVEQPEAFWSGLARSRLTWSNDFHTGMDCSMETGHFRWFEGGKLNVSVNCVDRCFVLHMRVNSKKSIHRWAAEDPERVALIWEKVLIWFWF